MTEPKALTVTMDGEYLGQCADFAKLVIGYGQKSEYIPLPDGDGWLILHPFGVSLIARWENAK